MFPSKLLFCPLARASLWAGFMLLCALVSSAAQQPAANSAAPPGETQPIGDQKAGNAEQNKTLLLKDFHPVSRLHASAHEVPRAKFYVIDVHNHVDDARGIEEPMDPRQVVQVMDRTNVRTVVILTGMWGEKLQRVVNEMVKPFPGRFAVFTEMDWSKIDDANFSQKMVAQLDNAVARGARGLKVLKDLGLGVRGKEGKLIAVDDPRLDPVWEECGRLRIPVAMHISDPEAFFYPVDASNERYEELMEHPDWSFYGPRFPQQRIPFGGPRPGVRSAPEYNLPGLAHGKLAGEPGLCVRGAQSLPQCDGGVRSTPGGAGAPAPAGTRILSAIPGPNHVRDG